MQNNLNYPRTAMEEDKEVNRVKLTVFLKEIERKKFKVLCAENEISMSAQCEEWISEANTERKRKKN